MRQRLELKTIWLNEVDLAKDENISLKNALLGKGKLLDFMRLSKDQIRYVLHKQWVIEGKEYEELKSKPSSEYISSPHYKYDVDKKCGILFRFRCYGRYSAADPHCAIFLEINHMPQNVKNLRIEVDIKCIKKKEYRQLLRRKALRNGKTYGFKCFEHSELEHNSRLQWMFGIKIFKKSERGVRSIDDSAYSVSPMDMAPGRFSESQNSYNH